MPLKAKFTVVAFLVLLLIASKAPAEELTPQIDPQSTKKISKDDRLKYANELLSFIKRLDSQIPALSQSREDWLRNELNEAKRDRRRYYEVIKTKEYDTSVVRQHLHTITYAVNKIIINLKHANQTPSVEKNEMYWWSEIGRELMDYQAWQSLLMLIEVHKVVDWKILLSERLHRANNLSQVTYEFYLDMGIRPAEQLIQSVIQPYLEK